MVETRGTGGKFSDMKMEPIWVVAGALAGPGDTWLLHQRPFEKHHGGLWEFPGGKVEDAEIPVKALIRELNEELGVEVAEEHCSPLGFAEDQGDGAAPPIVILLYKVSDWRGEPAALEGEGIGWFSHDQIDALRKPPLDEQLAGYLAKKFK